MKLHDIEVAVQSKLNSDQWASGLTTLTKDDTLGITKI